MSIMFNLSKNQKAMAVNLAMLVECGLVPVTEVVEMFKKDAKMTKKVTGFWLEFSDTTRRALDMVMIETARQHFELCLQLDCKGHNELEN